MKDLIKQLSEEEKHTIVEKLRTQLAERSRWIDPEGIYYTYGGDIYNLICSDVDDHNERLLGQYRKDISTDKFNNIVKGLLPYEVAKKRTITQLKEIPFYCINNEEYATVIERDNRLVVTTLSPSSKLILTNFFDFNNSVPTPKQGVEILTQNDFIKFVTEGPTSRLTYRQNVFRQALLAVSPRRRSSNTLNEDKLLKMKRRLRAGASISKVASEFKVSRKAVYNAIGKIVDADAEKLTQEYYRHAKVLKNKRRDGRPYPGEGYYVSNSLFADLTSNKAFDYASNRLSPSQWDELEYGMCNIWDFPGFRAAYYGKLKQWTRDLRFALRGFDFEDLPTFN